MLVACDPTIQREGGEGVMWPTFWLLYVPVTVHREQSVKKEYQQDATI